MNNCLTCGAEITNKRAGAKYCCDRCRVISYRVRNLLPDPFSGMYYFDYMTEKECIKLCEREIKNDKSQGKETRFKMHILNQFSETSDSRSKLTFLSVSIRSAFDWLNNVNLETIRKIKI